MNEEQADRIIELLAEIRDATDNVYTSISSIEDITETGLRRVASELDDVKKAIRSIR